MKLVSILNQEIRLARHTFSLKTHQKSILKQNLLAMSRHFCSSSENPTQATELSSKNQKPDQKKNPKKNLSKGQLSLLDQFSLCELVVGELSEVAAHPEAEKLYTEKVIIRPQTTQTSFSSESLSEDSSAVRNVASGLRDFVPLEGMTGKVLLFKNLKPSKLKGFVSEGMLLCSADKKSEDPFSHKIELCRPDNDSQPGERVYPEGLSPEEEAEFQTSTDLARAPPSAVKAVLAALQTDSQGRICLEEKLLRTKSGFLQTSSLKNCPVS